ncbi:MAG: hypothetical protein A3A97_03930 [Candidatus Terrybacteria bacterium RIFCSPLOWO2_01_FULL_40_23]|uniref:Uncharacterized protein n=1 Tax=Candidatus Terrybacteria bacterium RIFCSPLOWO2_01_FULL_40_23 TaxID=1802366 RepID=A0A1G2PW42_9BACT|nr:MAG: hypothetical protein A3A97_03930 [Candidatus Terrybacteria bacterium RIFCSPLOWO2_01_FULL_40_23]
MCQVGYIDTILTKITMEFGRQLNNEILELLEDTKREFLLRLEGQEFFKFSIFPTGVSVENPNDAQKTRAVIDKKRKILLKLADMGAIEIKPDTDEIDGYESAFLIKVNPKRFAEIHNQVSKQKGLTSDTRLFTPDVKPQAEISGLAVYGDGSIRYKGEAVEMRSQLKELCRLFITNHNRLIMVDDIKDELISANKREHTSFTTIAKYVSELHGILRVHFKKDVISNQKKEGWWFKP